MRGWTQEFGFDKGFPKQKFLKRHSTRKVLRSFCRRPLAGLGGLLVLVVIIGVILGPLVATNDPTTINEDAILDSPGPRYLLGTDNLGRDVFARLVYGGRVSLYVGLVSVALGSAVGAGLGLLSGYRGGYTDIYVQLFLDTLLAFPSLILAMVIVAVLGNSLNNIVIAIGVIQLPWVARVVRGAAISVRDLQYVEAARITGCSDSRIVAVHILPQCLVPLLVVTTSSLGAAIMTEASLSFLGLGTPPPYPSWGGMLSGTARDFVFEAPWMVIPPGFAIALVVYGVNLLGDSLRDLLDPRLREL